MGAWEEEGGAGTGSGEREGWREDTWVPGDGHRPHPVGLGVLRVPG